MAKNKIWNQWVHEIGNVWSENEEIKEKQENDSQNFAVKVIVGFWGLCLLVSIILWLQG